MLEEVPNVTAAGKNARPTGQTEQAGWYREGKNHSLSSQRLGERFFAFEAY